MKKVTSFYTLGLSTTIAKLGHKKFDLLSIYGKTIGHNY